MPRPRTRRQSSSLLSPGCSTGLYLPTIAAMSSPTGSPERPQPPEEALEQLAEQRRLALDTAQMGWWSLEVESGHVHWDERIRAMFELDRENLHYLEVLPLLHPEDRSRLDRAIKASIDPVNPQPYS